MKTATIILNRNLPDVTDRLWEHLDHYDRDLTDIYVVEAGSEPGALSCHATWYADWDEARAHGLRYGRGMNYGLSQLWKENRFEGYDAFFLLTNDTELQPAPTLAPLAEIFDAHPRVGILAPCSREWGESLLLGEKNTRYFWFIHNNAYLLRRKFIECVYNPEDEPGYRNFLFDGDNFRGYGQESELIAKAYANNWAAAITSAVWAEENQSHLLNKADLIKTELFEENRRLYVEEGERWMHRKYGFNSRWSMQQYVKSFYDLFFQFNPECEPYKI
ncbi:hypothetical protein FACS1894205_1790 [Alphaproteobacteria bacterium]|nr:hypothetical protein FACS1894205_1790 [Alphaproteobacteria bacterium]